MKIDNELLEKIKKEAKKHFSGLKGCHDWNHVVRVRDLAVKIAKKEKEADINIVRISAYLHDIGRKDEIASKGKICHAQRGTELAEKIMRSCDIDSDALEKIKNCILSHRYRNGIKPSSIEAKILYDADKLDSIGAVGIARNFLFTGSSGSNCLYTGNEKKLSRSGGNYTYKKNDSALLEYYIKLKKIRSKMMTEEGRRIARKRHNYMVVFFKEFEKEISGTA